MAALHPYYPVDVEIPGYLANEWSLTTLLAVFGSACAFVLASAWLVARAAQPDLSRSEVLTVLWFALCASIHLLFESYFVRNWSHLAERQGLFGQLWKEYAYSDSRYLIQDVQMLCLEAITVAFWGPLSFITAYMILTSHPMRYGFQLLISMAHLHSVMLYYATSLTELWFLGKSYSRPEALYFWVYFIGFNAPWFFVPAILICTALKEVAKLSSTAASREASKRGNGKPKNM